MCLCVLSKEMLNRLTDNGRKQVVGCTTCSDAIEVLGEPLFAQDRLDNAVILDGIGWCTHTSGHLDSHLVACLLIIRLGGLSHHEHSLWSSCRLKLACACLDEVGSRINCQDTGFHYIACGLESTCLKDDFEDGILARRLTL